MTDMAVKRGRDEEREEGEKGETTDNVRAENLIGIAAVVVLIAASLARAFGGPPSLYRVTAGAALLLIAAGYRRINPKLRNTSFVLFAAGALALPWARDPSSAIQRGVFVAGLLLSLTASVMLIARCAMQSRRIHAIGAGLREREGGSRYLAFTLVSQFFSGILGLAGAHLMFIMAAPATEAVNPTRTASVVAVTRGFAAASCWSPVFGNMAILLALYPSLHWIEVFPVGFALGQLTIAVGALTNRSGRRPRDPEQARPTSTWTLVSAALPLLLSLLAFLAAIIVIGNTLHIVISAAIVLLAPFLSLAFHAATGKPGRRLADGARGLGRGMRQFPTLANEAILFISAGCAGSVMADAFPGAWAATIGQVLSAHPFWGLSFLLFGIMAAALAGIHPVLSAVFLATTLPPALLGLPPLTHMAAILAGWGLSASLTPFSVLSLTASRYAGVGLYQISLGKNGAFVLFNSLLICALLSAYVLLR